MRSAVAAVLFLLLVASFFHERAEPKAEVPVVRAAECRWAKSPIKIDGVINEAAWDGAQEIKDFAVFWQNRKARTATTARLLWDDAHLYFMADMEDQDLYADVKERNGMAVSLRGTLNDHRDVDKGWTVEGRIPWKAFEAAGGKPKPGDKWRFALCRYDYSVMLENPELSSTAPLTIPSFHQYEDYGVLTFVGGG